MDCCRILIIDGNVHVRSLVRAILAGIPGAEVCECGDAASAVALAAHWRADAALVDFDVQPMNGVLFTERVRAGETPLPSILPIVMMSASGDDIRQAIARRAGADAFLAKPLTAVAVVETLRKLLQGPADSGRLEPGGRLDVG